MRGTETSIQLLLPAALGAATLAHLARYAVFQKVTVADRSEAFLRLALYGPEAPALAAFPHPLPGEGEIAAEILADAGSRGELEAALARAGSVTLSPASAEILRVEAGRPRWGTDFGPDNFVDEVGLAAAVSATKGCYVGQEIVARTRTYGRVNRRLVAFRFPEGPIDPGELLTRPGEATGKIDIGRVTSCAVSRRRAAIGLGFAFREIAAGERLEAAGRPGRGAVVEELPPP